MNDFIKSLKVGDSVIVEGYNQKRLTKVAKVTKTQIVLETGDRFRIDTGWRIGGSAWRSAYLSEATDVEVAKIKNKAKKKLLASELSSYNWYRLTLEQLERVKEALPPEHKKEIR